MSSYDEQRKKQARWPWGEIPIHPDFVITQNADDDLWQLQDCPPGRAVWTIGNSYASEDAARSQARLSSQYRYKENHSPEKYGGRIPVLYAEPDAVTEWDRVVANIPVPTLVGMQQGGCLIVDQSVHPAAKEERA